MATAGSIVVDLLARTGSFETDMNRAARAAKRAGSEISTSWGKVQTLVATSIAGISAVGIFQRVISETRNFEQEQAQLAAVLKSTGNAAGFSRDQLNDMASAMSRSSLLTGGEISQAQTALLAFTGIVGNQFAEALQAAVDMSARTGMSVASAAETIGRALDVPSKGLAALSKQGFRFTDDQKKLAERLEATGKTAEAQGMILSALKESYGGAAAAARNTFGGALTGLQNTISDLMSGGDGSLDGARDAINDLTGALESEDTKRAFAEFVRMVTDATTKMVEFAAASRFGWAGMLGNLEIGMFSTDDAEGKIKRLRAEIEDTKTAMENAGDVNSWVFQQGINFKEGQIAALEAQIKAAERDYVQNNFVGPMLPTTLDPISISPSGRSSGSTKKQLDEGTRYIQQLNQRIALLGKETEHEQLLARISAGTLKFKTPEMEKQAKLLAEQLDLSQRQIEVEEVLKGLRTQQSVTQLQFMRDLESFGQGDRIRELNADLAKVEDRYRSLIEARRNSAQGLSDTELEQIRESLQVELDMVRDFHEKKRAIEQDGALGAIDALRNYADEAANVYDSMGRMVSGAFRGMEDALTNFVTTGKLDFKSLADSIIKDMVRIAIQQSITGPLAGMMFGAFSGPAAPAGVTPGVNWTFSSGGYTGDGGKYEPAGIVHRGEGVLNQEEIRALGGESGFNALRRAIRTGHAAGGMAGRPMLPPSAPASGRANVNVTVNVANGQSQTQAPAGWEDFAKEIGDFVDARIREREIKSQRQGGLAWQAKQGAFG